MKNQIQIPFIVLVLSCVIVSWCLPPISLSPKTIEKTYTDSLSSVLIKSELLSVMDTTLSTLEGKMVDFDSNTPIKKQFISIKCGFKLHLIKTDSAGHFIFQFISPGDYSIRVTNRKYLPFTIDSLHLEAGDIRGLTIGMRKL